MTGYLTRKRKRDLESLVQQSISFLDLPPEIRTQIYYAALVPGEGYLVPQRSSAPCRGLPMEPGLEYDFSSFTRCEALSILRLCKVVHIEAAHVLYSMNEFAVYQTRPWLSLLDFLQAIGPRNRASLRRLRCCTPSWSDYYRRLSDSYRVFGSPLEYRVPIYLDRKRRCTELIPFMEELLVYTPSLSLDMAPYVRFLDPAMIDCIELLAHAQSHVQLEIEASGTPPLIPPNRTTVSWDIPHESRIMEDCCKQLSKGTAQIKARWVYHDRLENWERQRSRAERCGWEILNEIDYQVEQVLFCKITGRLNLAADTSKSPDFTKRKHCSYQNSFIYMEDA